MKKYSSDEKISILDIGCGNGRFLDTLKTSGFPYSYLGIDESSGMINEARKLHPQQDFKVLDMNHLGKLLDSGISQKRSDSSANRDPEGTVRSQYGEGGSGDLSSKDKFFRDSYQFIIFIASFHHLHTKEERKEVLLQAKRLLVPDGVIMMTNWNLIGEKLFKKYEKSYRGNGDFGIKIGIHERYYHGFSVMELDELFQESGYEILENRIFEGEKNIVSLIKSK
ncbi:MAG: class I SAM-dependent methyltransferase [Candidatus Gracilibacteria bacterium]|nr:class I SAM-dependent methyltransferase [Candidatus Gracilibacteria bacterium]